jgi:hypothetical protein
LIYATLSSIATCQWRFSLATQAYIESAECGATIRKAFMTRAAQYRHHTAFLEASAPGVAMRVPSFRMSTGLTMCSENPAFRAAARSRA